MGWVGLGLAKGKTGDAEKMAFLRFGVQRAEGENSDDHARDTVNDDRLA